MYFPGTMVPAVQTVDAKDKTPRCQVQSSGEHAVRVSVYEPSYLD
jgi:hypothetical protein